VRDAYYVDYPEFKPLIALIFFGYIGAFFLQVGSRIDFFGAIRLEFLLAATLLILALVYDPKTQYPPSTVKILLFFYIFLVAIQVPLSVDVVFSWQVFVDRFLKFSAMAIFISKFVNNPNMLLVFLAAFLLSCFKMGQEGMLGKITGSMVWENQGIMRLHGSTAMYRHPNSFAGMALGTLPFLYYLFPLAGKYLKGFYLVMVVFAFNIVIFCGSRTAYVAFLVMFLLIFRNAKNKAKYFALSLIVATAGSFFMPVQYIERFESIFGGKEKSGHSGDARILISQQAVEVLIRNPLGVGVSAFPIVRMEYFDKKQDTYNLYLQVATNLGIQGLIIFLVLFGIVLKQLNGLRIKFEAQIISMEKVAPDKFEDEDLELYTDHIKDLRLYRAMASAVLTYLIVRLALGLFGHDLYEIYWWIVLGFLFSLEKLDFVAEKRTSYLCKKASIS